MLKDLSEEPSQLRNLFPGFLGGEREGVERETRATNHSLNPTLNLCWRALAAWRPGVLEPSLSPLACPGTIHSAPTLREALYPTQLGEKLDPRSTPGVLMTPNHAPLSPILSSAQTQLQSTSCRVQLPPCPQDGHQGHDGAGSRGDKSP